MRWLRCKKSFNDWVNKNLDGYVKRKSKTMPGCLQESLGQGGRSRSRFPCTLQEVCHGLGVVASVETHHFERLSFRTNPTKRSTCYHTFNIQHAAGMNS